jgi:DMSO reductase anchor subunit
MLQSLPLVLFIVLTELSIGSVAVLVFLDWRSDVKRGFLISYACIYLFLTFLTYLFQQSFAYPVLLNSYTHVDRGWTGALGLPLLLFFVLLIPYTLFLFLDRSAGIDGKVAREKAAVENEGAAQKGSIVRTLRLLSGAATVLAGLVTLLVMAMIFRPLATTGVGGFFTVLAFFAAAFALGGVMTAMWLGHWYLVTPALTEKPLLFSTTLVLVALVAQIAFSFLVGPTVASAQGANAAPAYTQVIGSSTPSAGNTQVKPTDAPVITPLSTDAIFWIRILVSFALPLILGALSWKLIRDRSFQSATGMLYLIVVLTLAGEGMARGLFLMGL